MDWNERSQRESTKNVLFLLQRRALVVIDAPSDYEFDEAGERFVSEDGAELDFKTCFDKGLERSGGGNAIMSEWVSERIFLDRNEAELWASQRYYNYPNGYRVYGLPAEGKIVELLKCAEKAGNPMISSGN